MLDDDFFDGVLAQFEPVRPWFMAFASRLEREVGAVDPKSIETSLQKNRSALRAVLGSEPAVKLQAVIEGCRRVLARDDLRNEATRRVLALFNQQARASCQSTVGRVVAPRLREAWERDPLALAILSTPTSPFRPSSHPIPAMFDWYRAVAYSLSAWEPYRLTRSPERRSEHLREYTQAVGEGVYKVFVYKLALLGSYLVGESPPPATTSLGTLVKAAANHFPTLVDLEAHHLRNAAAHRHWRFQPLSKTVALHNQKETWKAELSVTDLGRRIKEMADTAVRGIHIIGGYGLHLLYVRSGLLEQSVAVASRWATGSTEDWRPELAAAAARTLRFHESPVARQPSSDGVR